MMAYHNTDSLIKTLKVVLVIWGGFIPNLFLTSAQAYDTSQCVGPLGMETKEIPNSDITASSSFDMSNVGPQNGRVRQEILGGAWCPKNQITSEAKEWMQIDLHSVHIITATETQGRFGNGHGREYAEAYVISYWRPELNRWVRYRDHTGNEIMTGNMNTYLPSKTDLNPPIVASKIRILPYSYHKRTVCMRAEIYGCPFRGGLLSYEMMQGSKRGENWNFYDQTYDGVWEGKYLRKGLGQLIDGKGGPDNFKDDFYDHERGKGWLGWKKDFKNSGKTVEIVFKFDSVREFDAVYIHSSNQFSREVQVFSEVRVYFSIGGKIFSKNPIAQKTVEDCIFEQPKNVSIDLHQRVGKFVKIQLFWASKWILISEVTFQSKRSLNVYEEESLNTTEPKIPEDVFMEEQEPIQRDAQPQSEMTQEIEDTVEGFGQSIVRQIPSLEKESSTIVITAVISSFIAIFIVTMLILTAFLVRNKICVRSKKSSHHAISVYENQNGEYGQPPQDHNAFIQEKLNGTGGPEYQEPFNNLARSNLSSFSSATNKSASTSYQGQTSGNGVHHMAHGVATNLNNHGKLTEYYSCTLISNPLPPDPAESCNEYEYAVPNELGKLLPNKSDSLKKGSSMDGRNLIHATGGPSEFNVQLRLRELNVPRIPRNQLKTVRKLGDGAFGSVLVGELINRNKMGGKELVTMKKLRNNASEKDKLDFLEEVRLLSSLKDPNITQVLGIGQETDVFYVILECLELGDLCQFLQENDKILLPSDNKLSVRNLSHIASQIASGMMYMESRNIVHRDLSARNCIIGSGLVVKISHFATDTDLYSSDYYKLDGKMPLPIRWMAWESLFLGKYSTKSDVWSFGVTVWEIFDFCRLSPYSKMNNQEVLHNLRRLSIYDIEDTFQCLSKPSNCPRDIYQLMCDAWRRNDDERPHFWELHSFLTRKTAHYITADNIVSSSYPQYMV